MLIHSTPAQNADNIMKVSCGMGAMYAAQMAFNFGTNGAKSADEQYFLAKDNTDSYRVTPH